VSQYTDVRNKLRPGDIVVFSGVQPISWLIKFYSNSPVTHAGIVTDVFGASDVQLSESTIENGKNGVQTNPLSTTLAGYGRGSSASGLLLRDEIRAKIDWTKFYAFITACTGQVKYDVKGLFLFLAASAPLFGQFVSQSEDPKQMFCDAWVIAVLEACGVLCGINYRKMKPQDLVEMALYQPAPLPLLGNLKLKRFNTI
jgi:hypothetical protein